MATLSKLSPDQRQQLIKQYGSSGGSLPKSVPTAQLAESCSKCRASRIKNRLRLGPIFWEILIPWKEMISADVARLQNQVDAENSSDDNELLEALEKASPC